MASPGAARMLQRGMLVCLQHPDLSRIVAHQAKWQRAATVSHGATSGPVCDTLLATTSADGSEAAERAPPPAAMGAEGRQTQDKDGELMSRLFLISCYLSTRASKGQAHFLSMPLVNATLSDRGHIPFMLPRHAAQALLPKLLHAPPALLCSFKHITQVPFVRFGFHLYCMAPAHLTVGAPVKKQTTRKKGGQADWSMLASSEALLASGAEQPGQPQPHLAGEQSEAGQPQAESRARGRSNGHSRGRGQRGRSRAAAGRGRQGRGATAEHADARAAKAEPQPASRHTAGADTAVQAAEADRASSGDPAAADAVTEQESAGNEGRSPAKVGAIQQQP